MKILIAFYSRGGNTEKLAEVLKKEFKNRGHSVNMERVKPIKEHSFLAWFFIRLFRDECNIQPPKIQDVSEYDLVCVGTPNWTRLSLPVARYLRQVKGLKYKNIGFFATTTLLPDVEWYILSMYLLDLTTSRIIERKGGRIIASVILSSFFKRWNFASEYGKRAIKNFCDKLETPIKSLKDYFLKQKEIESARLSIVIFSIFLFFSLIYQIVSPLFNAQVLTWNEYFYLFIIGFFAYFATLTMLAGRVGFSWGKYLTSISFVAGLTIIILFLTPTLGRPIISGYVLIFILISFFRDVKTVLFTGLVTVLGYIFLLFNYPQKDTLILPLDFTLLLFSLGIISFVTQNLQKHHIDLLEAQDEIETARAALEIKVTARTSELRELSENLERQVKERTKELQEKMEDLEKFNKLAVGRELKMVELKKEIKKIKKELGESKGGVK